MWENQICGKTHMLTSVPGKDGVIIRDSVGNLYRIKSLSMLDARSRKEFEKVI